MYDFEVGKLFSLGVRNAHHVVGITDIVDTLHPPPPLLRSPAPRSTFPDEMDAFIEQVLSLRM